jgi:hypothetical protein
MKYLALVFGFACLLSCHSSDEKIKDSKSIKDTTNITAPAARDTGKTFFDSVAQKKDLSLDQIKAHTTIDSIFYTGRYQEASYSGDSIIRFKDSITGAIIIYNDGSNCTKKLLLLFVPGSTINSDYKEIKTDCDRDFSGDFYYVRYKLLGDSILETREYHIPPNKEDDYKGSLWERIRWRVNNKGIFETVLEKRYD